MSCRLLSVFVLLVVATPGRGDDKEGAKVKFLKVDVRTIPLLDIVGNIRTTDAKYMLVAVEVRNFSETKKVDYLGAASSFLQSHATLTDEFGNNYRAIDFTPDRQPSQKKEEAIYPGTSITDVYIFQRPVPKARKFVFTIKAKALERDSDAALRFELAEDPYAREKQRKDADKPASPRTR